MAWNPGQKLQNGKYTIEKVLGQGGFGIAYLVKNKKGNLLVIKTLNHFVQRQHDFGKFQQDFLNEAVRLAKFNHPHIVKIEEVIQEDGLWCIVMEYIAGESLAHRVWQKGAMCEAEALRYIQQIGAALTLVHNNGLLHRDVKPLNIMLRCKNATVVSSEMEGVLEAVLVDFGIAREFTPDITQTQTEFCSSGFAPIEQYDWRSKRGAYTDVYSLAATLYTLLTAQVPTPSPMRAYGMELTPPKQINSLLGDRANYAIVKGMALKPEDRPQSVQEWLALLGILSPRNVNPSPLVQLQERLREAQENKLNGSNEWRERFRKAQEDRLKDNHNWRDRLRKACQK